MTSDEEYELEKVADGKRIVDATPDQQARFDVVYEEALRQNIPVEQAIQRAIATGRLP